jgi:hypothetical protein
MRWWTLRNLRSRNPENRVRAIIEIKTWGKSEAMEMILPLLADADETVLKTAIEVVSSISQDFDVGNTPLRMTRLFSQAIESLISIISRYYRSELGMMAAHALESIADDEILRSYVTHDDRNVGMAVALILV